MQLVTEKHNAGKFVGAVAERCGGKGGGRPGLAAAGAKDATGLDAALEAGRRQMMESM